MSFGLCERCGGRDHSIGPGGEWGCSGCRAVAAAADNCVAVIDDDDDDDDGGEPSKEPYLIESQAEIDAYPPFLFPAIGEYDAGDGGKQLADGWEAVRELFCDASGVGRPGEAALTIGQLKRELRPGFAYAITGEGPFQVHVTEYRRSGE